MKRQKQKRFSTWGYVKAKSKIDSEAYKLLINKYLKIFYNSSNKIKKYKGNMLVAIDGCDLHIPTTKETLRVYGGPPGIKAKNRAMASFSSAFDVLNNQFLDCSLEKYKLNERMCAQKHIEKIETFFKGQKIIYIFDRGYLSLEFLLNLMNKNKQFIFRLSSTMFREEQKKWLQMMNLQCFQ